MKKIILGITATIMSIGVFAQPDQKHPNAPDTVGNQTSNSKHADGYVMKKGKMMCVKDHKMTLLKNDTTLMNGTMVMRDGNFMRKGGTKMMFKEGQHMDMNGRLLSLSMVKDPEKKLDGKKKMYLVRDTLKHEKHEK